MLATKNGIREIIEATKPRNQWSKGVKDYALDLLENLDPSIHYTTLERLQCDLIRGCVNWAQYSSAPYALVASWDIAERMLTAADLRRIENGTMDIFDIERIQIRALNQADTLIQYVAVFGEA